MYQNNIIYIYILIYDEYHLYQSQIKNKQLNVNMRHTILLGFRPLKDKNQEFNTK